MQFVLDLLQIMAIRNKSRLKILFCVFYGLIWILLRLIKIPLRNTNPNIISYKFDRKIYNASNSLIPNQLSHYSYIH